MKKKLDLLTDQFLRFAGRHSLLILNAVRHVCSRGSAEEWVDFRMLNI